MNPVFAGYTATNDVNARILCRCISTAPDVVSVPFGNFSSP